MLRILLLINIICQAVSAVSIAEMSTNTADNYEQCLNNMEVSGPIKITKHGQVIENKIIIANPTSDDDRSNDFAIYVGWNIRDVVIRNVVVYHAANGIGIFGWKS